MVLASEPVGGRSRVTELPCFMGDIIRYLRVCNIIFLVPVLGYEGV